MKGIARYIGGDPPASHEADLDKCVTIDTTHDGRLFHIGQAIDLDGKPYTIRKVSMSTVTIGPRRWWETLGDWIRFEWRMLLARAGNAARTVKRIVWGDS